jgi:hypothetical protein
MRLERRNVKPAQIDVTIQPGATRSQRIREPSAQNPIAGIGERAVSLGLPRVDRSEALIQEART